MPVDIAGIRKRGAEVKVPFFGETITVIYDPITAMGPEFKKESKQREKELLAEVGKWVEEFFENLRQQEIPEGFPARKHLLNAGFTTYGDIPLLPKDLQKVRNIGPATAQAIVNAVNTDLRIDETEISRRREHVFAELACMVVREWDLTEATVPLAIAPESFEGLPGLAKAITTAIENDIAQLGNSKTSNVTRAG